jgi:hypothetical protein
MLDPNTGPPCARCTRACTIVPLRNFLVQTSRAMHVDGIRNRGRLGNYTWNPLRTSALDHESVAEDLGGLLLTDENGGFGLQPPADLQRAYGQLGPSPEFQQMAFIQCNLLVSTLEYRLKREGGPTTGIRCALYCRSPMSMPHGQLQLHLVAASDIREAEAAKQRNSDLILGMPEANGPEQEAWLVEQNLIVLPDSGGLVLPLAHASFLVGLLVVECGISSEGAGVGNEQYQRTMNATLRPPACSVFSTSDLAFIRQTGSSLALACAMDLNALLERAGNSVQRRRKMQGIVTKVKTPLRTLRGLSSMLRPRLRKGDPEHDMNEGIIAQGEELNDLISQLQNALSVSQQRFSSRTTDISLSTLSSSPPAPSGLWPQSLLQSPSLPSNPKPRLKSTQSWDDSVTATIHPALPSSSIGADNLGGRPMDIVQGSMVVNKQSPLPVYMAQGTDLLTILNPILTSAGTFARIGGVSFETSIDSTVISILVSIDGTSLKQIISQFFDIALACAKKGDSMMVVLSEDDEANGNGSGIAIQILVSLNEPEGTGRFVGFGRCTSDFDALSRYCKGVGAKLSVGWPSPGPVATLTASLWLPRCTQSTQLES